MPLSCVFCGKLFMEVENYITPKFPVFFPRKLANLVRKHKGPFTFSFLRSPSKQKDHYGPVFLQATHESVAASTDFSCTHWYTFDWWPQLPISWQQSTSSIPSSLCNSNQWGNRTSYSVLNSSKRFLVMFPFHFFMFFISHLISSCIVFTAFILIYWSLMQWKFILR